MLCCCWCPGLLRT
uniref:Uncharacterized protein n=1 Tax=Anguilla anguilla TaxID=7936 RepID=A0A0E9S6W3_ANGAN